MRAIEYALREGWGSLRRNRGSSSFAIAAIALAMMVFGALLLFTWNVEQLMARWTSAAEFSVFLHDEATSEQRGTLEALIDQSGAADGREYVSKTEALTRFRQDFADLASLTETLDENPFPASVEVRVRPEAGADGRAEALVRRVVALPGVADVQYDREWLARIASGLAAIRGAGFAIGILMAVAAAITVAAVVRLGLYARRDELEIMRLVGSPAVFIRGPFVAEGLLQGGAGAVLALGVLWLTVAGLSAGWGNELASVLAGGSLEFLPAGLCGWLVAGGMVVGSAGGFVASRHAV